MALSNTNNDNLNQLPNTDLTYIQTVDQNKPTETILNNSIFHGNKQGAIMRNILDARLYKKEYVDLEHNMLIAFDEANQDKYIENIDEHYIDNVSNYITMLKEVKASKLTNFNMKATVQPLNENTIHVKSKLDKVISIFYDLLNLDSRNKEAALDMVLLGDGYTTLYKSSSPAALQENFRNKKILKNNDANIGSRNIDARKMLLDQGALSLQEGMFCAEEGRVSLMYVKQVISEYFSKDVERAKDIYTKVMAAGQVPGDIGYTTGEYLFDNGRYSNTNAVVRMYVYYEKEMKGNRVQINRYYLANDILIAYDENIGTRFPYATWRAHPKKDTPYSQSYMSKILPIQKVIDQIDAIVLTIGIQTVTPGIVLNKNMFQHEKLETLVSAVFGAGDIVLGNFGPQGNEKPSQLFKSPEIPQQLITLRDGFRKDLQEIINISDINMGKPGSLQKKGAVEDVIAETDQGDRFHLDLYGLTYLREVHHLLMELLIETISVSEDIVVPDITNENGYISLNLTQSDLTSIAYAFEFTVDMSPLDKEGNDEAILTDLMKIEAQYNKENPIPIVTPEEVLRGSTLSGDIKADIINRIKQDREKLQLKEAEAARILDQQSQQPVQPQAPAQGQVQQPQVPIAQPQPLVNPMDALAQGQIPPDLEMLIANMVAPQQPATPDLGALLPLIAGAGGQAPSLPPDIGGSPLVPGGIV